MISNIVVGCVSRELLDLEKIALNQQKNVKFRPEKFPGLTLKIDEPKSTVLLFSNGKLMSLGSKSIHATILCFEKVYSILKNLGYKAHFINFKIHNFVVSDSINKHINLSKFYYKYRKQCILEQEFFPGVEIKFETPRCTCILFRTGKFYVTGCKNKNDAFNVCKRVKSFVVNL